MNDEEQTSYREYAKRQVETITEALTEVMLGNFSVVARTSEPDDTFGYLCVMVNVAINAARNAQQELQAKIVELETEVAERKQAEAAFRESEERLQLALRASRAGMFDYDVATQRCIWDDRTLEIFGLSEADRCVDDAFFYSLVHPEDRPRLRAIEEQALASESHYSVDYRIAGEERYVQARCVILRNDQGEAVRVIGVIFDITERKRAEEALRESEARNRALLSAIPDMIFTFGEDGTYLDFMPAPEVEPYVKPEDFLGKTVHEVLPADKAQRTMQDIRRALETGAVQRHEYTLVSGEEQRDFEYRIVPSGDDEVLAIVRDISARKQAEEALKQSEEKFRTLAEESPNMIFINQWGRVVYANRKCEEVLGYTREELYAPDFHYLTLIAPESMETVKSSYGKHMKGEEVATYEYTLITKEGKRIEAILTPRLIPYQGESAILGIVTDITARKQAEEALRESEERYLSLAEASFEGLLIHDRGRIIDTNTRFQEMFGYPLEELIGMSTFELVAPKDREIVQQNISERKEEPYEEVGLRKDATTFPMEIQVRHMQYRGAHVRVAACRDITERKKIEQEREKMLAELEDKNAELERFTYTVSHDLKSPLVIIKGFVGMLRVDAWSENPERMENDIQHIERATDKMGRLLGDLLELSRIGRLMNPPEAVSLTNIAEEAVEIVAGQISARGVDVAVAPEMPVVHGDRVRLVEVFQNLIDNAVQFIGDPEQPRVEIGATKQNGEILCSIRDNGIGIDSHYHEKIFGLFERLDAQSEGTGIGLALVKRIVEAHGGRIWVESEGEGQGGSTFWFTLPEDGVSIPPASGALQA